MREVISRFYKNICRVSSVPKRVTFLLFIFGVVGAIYDPGKWSNDRFLSEHIKGVETVDAVELGYFPNKEDIQRKSKSFQMAPELKGITGYINTEDQITLRSLKGSVVLLEFWTYT